MDAPASRSRVQIDDRVDRASTDGAERNGVAREDDAFGLRPVVAARFIVRAFERADLSAVRRPVQHRGLVLLLLFEECIHLGFGPIRAANRAPLLLNLFREPLELFFRPRRWNRGARRDEILPL